MKDGKHVVVYTGAGVSTSASLPDYVSFSISLFFLLLFFFSFLDSSSSSFQRGPQGVWTLLATGGIRSKPSVQLGEAWPTYTHFALVELIRKGYVHYITSTNLDGLHRRSGVPAKNIAELHGNW
jgi:mono-ADP-ribosyltransferase sirtuin 6